MRVSVLYFGVLTELVGCREALVEVAAGTSVAGLLASLRVPEEGVWKALAVAVNREYAGLGTVLQDGDEVALLPPVSGGSCGPTHRKRRDEWGTRHLRFGSDGTVGSSSSEWLVLSFEFDW